MNCEIDELRSSCQLNHTHRSTGGVAGPHPLCIKVRNLFWILLFNIWFSLLRADLDLELCQDFIPEH